MTTSNSKPFLFPTQNRFLFLLATFVFFLLLLNKVNSSDSLSFDFPNFGPDVKDIIFQGDAIQSSGTLKLTSTDEDGNPLQNSAGRALYSAPVHLWEGSTGRLASFYTIFTFVIIPGPDSEGDGLTFFIAPPETEILNGSAGGFLGLFNSDTAFDPSQNQIVAVEFDTYTNDWDPALDGTPYPHLGIDVSTIESLITADWDINSVPAGSVATAQVSYDSVSKTLRASLSYPDNNGKIKDAALSPVIDLRGVLPEWVRVGFSGATGGAVETHNILSWSFTSSLEGSTAEKKMFLSSKAKKKTYVARSVV